MWDKNIILQNKPLIEAIFELQWLLQEKNGVRFDPHYRVLIGQIFEKIKSEYPVHRELPQAAIPDEAAAHMVQHQFRTSEGGWPVMQLGPGIVSANVTDGYTPEGFKSQVAGLLDALFDVYPSNGSGLTPTSLLLRYIDAVEFDFDQENILGFLGEELKTKIQFDNSLFEVTNVAPVPFALDLRFVFASTDPVGAVHARFVRGKKNGVDALIWETQVAARGEDAPAGKEEILEWLDAAHSLTHNWFFQMIDGNLLERFR